MQEDTVTHRWLTPSLPQIGPPALCLVLTNRLPVGKQTVSPLGVKGHQLCNED